jgi:predicted transcriptional regulator
MSTKSNEREGLAMSYSSIALPLPAELEVLEIVWWRGPITAKEMHQILVARHGAKARSYRSVKTTLTIMQAKGLLVKQVHYPSKYQASLSKRELQQHVLSELAGALFGDMTGLFHTITTHPQLQLEKEKTTSNLSVN